MPFSLCKLLIDIISTYKYSVVDLQKQSNNLIYPNSGDNSELLIVLKLILFLEKGASR